MHKIYVHLGERQKRLEITQKVISGTTGRLEDPVSPWAWLFVNRDY